MCLLSGSDYPLRSAEYIQQFFSIHKGAEFINTVPIPCEPVNKPIDRKTGYRFQTHGQTRVGTGIVRALNHYVAPLLARDHERHLGAVKPYAGSQWCTYEGSVRVHSVVR